MFYTTVQNKQFIIYLFKKHFTFLLPPPPPPPPSQNKQSPESFSDEKQKKKFSLRGGRLEGKGKGVLGARKTRGTREEGGSAPRVSLAPKTPFRFPFKRLPRRLEEIMYTEQGLREVEKNVYPRKKDSEEINRAKGNNKRPQLVSNGTWSPESRVQSGDQSRVQSRAHRKKTRRHCK